MKDKLVKTGHRRHYYALRRFSKMAFAIAIMALVASVPVAIAYGVSVAEAKAESAKTENSEEQNSLIQEISTSLA